MHESIHLHGFMQHGKHGGDITTQCNHVWHESIEWFRWYNNTMPPGPVSGSTMHDSIHSHVAMVLWKTLNWNYIRRVQLLEPLGVTSKTSTNDGLKGGLLRTIVGVFSDSDSSRQLLKYWSLGTILTNVRLFMIQQPWLLCKCEVLETPLQGQWYVLLGFEQCRFTKIFKAFWKDKYRNNNF